MHAKSRRTSRTVLSSEARNEAIACPKLGRHTVHQFMRHIEGGLVVVRIDPFGGRDLAYPIEAVKPVGSHCF